MTSEAVRERCRVFIGVDRCNLVTAHDGDHAAIWGGGVVVRWKGDEPYSHEYPFLFEGA